MAKTGPDPHGAGQVYDPDISIWRLVRKWRGTLLPPIFYTMLVTTGITVLLLMIVTVLKDGGPTWLSSTLKIISNAKAPIATFYAFSSAFAVSQAYGRWWGLRQDIMPIGGQDLSLQISAWVHDPVVRSEMVRYTNLAHALFLWQVRSFHESTSWVVLGKMEHSSKSTFYDYLEVEGTLTPEERKVMEPKANHFQVAYQFLLNTLSRARANRALHCDEDVEFMQETVSKMRGNCSRVMFTLGTPLPLAYFHAIGFMMAVVIASTICEVVFKWRYSEPKGTWSSIWSPLITVALQNGVTASLFHLLRILSNPFGDDCSDFPLEKLYEGAKKFSTQQLQFAAFDKGPDGSPLPGADGVDWTDSSTTKMPLPRTSPGF